MPRRTRVGGFLRSAPEDVYDSPQAPDRHRAAFVDACVARAGG
jgi:hypothetical protein